MENLIMKHPINEKRAVSNAAESFSEQRMDAIGLARQIGFEDGPSTVRVLSEIQLRREKWQPASPTFSSALMSVRDANALITEFRHKHQRAEIEQRYLTPRQSTIRLTARYKEDLSDCRMTFSSVI